MRRKDGFYVELPVLMLFVFIRFPLSFACRHFMSTTFKSLADVDIRRALFNVEYRCLLIEFVSIQLQHPVQM